MHFSGISKGASECGMLGNAENKMDWALKSTEALREALRFAGC